METTLQATALTSCRREHGDSYWQISLFSYPDAPDAYPIGYEAVARLDGKDYDKTIIPGDSGLMGGFRQEWDALWSAHNWVSKWLKEAEMGGDDTRESPLLLELIRLFSPYYGFKGPFSFNRHNCCINPEVLTLKENKVEIEISLAATPAGQWGFGFSVSTSNAGHSFSVSGKSCTYGSREEALHHAVQYGKQSGLVIEARATTLLDKLIGKTVQLSLF